MALMTIADGASMITETIFENRFMHVPELCGMGANINVHGASAMVRGVHAAGGRAGDGDRSARLGVAGPGRARRRGRDHRQPRLPPRPRLRAARGKARRLRRAHREAARWRLTIMLKLRAEDADDLAVISAVRAGRARRGARSCLRPRRAQLHAGRQPFPLGEAASRTAASGAARSSARCARRRLRRGRRACPIAASAAATRSASCRCWRSGSATSPEADRPRIRRRRDGPARSRRNPRAFARYRRAVADRLAARPRSGRRAMKHARTAWRQRPRS